MVKEFNIQVPQSLDAISLRDYQKWMKILEKYDKDERDDEQYLRVKLLQTFCNLSIEDTYDVPLQSFDYIVKHISDLFAGDKPLIRRFEFTDPNNETFEFGLIPNFDKMSFGEYVDIDTYINDVHTMHKAMAVLFRPISNTIKDTYKIQKYKGSQQKELASRTLASSKELMMGELERQLKLISEGSSDGSQAFTLWLKKMQLKSMMQ
jgi:hypothetical protein